MRGTVERGSHYSEKDVRPQKVKLHFIKIQMVFSLTVANVVCLFSMRDKQLAKSSSRIQQQNVAAARRS